MSISSVKDAEGIKAEISNAHFWIRWFQLVTWSGIQLQLDEI